MAGLKPRRIPRWIAVGALLVLLVISGVVLQFGFGSNPTATHLSQLLTANTARAVLERTESIRQLGPEALPLLAVFAQQEETSLMRGYRRLDQLLPPSLRKITPKPANRDRLRQTALTEILSLGPIAARAAADSLELNVKENLSMNHQFRAISALKWVLFDHPERAARLADLAQQQRPWFTPIHLFRIDAIRTHVPKSSLLNLTNLLSSPHLVASVCPLFPRDGNYSPELRRSLNAVARHGTTGKTWKNPNVSQPMLELNRKVAIELLAEETQPASDTIALLIEAWDDPSPEVQTSAAKSIRQIGPRPEWPLERFHTELDGRIRVALTEKIQALGYVGPPTEAALNTLVEIAQGNRTTVVLDNRTVVRTSGYSETIRLLAQVALCRISPRVFIPKHGRAIVDQLGNEPEAFDFLLERPIPQAQAVPLLTAELQAGTRQRRMLVAALLLRYLPDNQAALTELRSQQSQGPIPQRILAANHLFQAVGETHQAKRLIQAGLRHPDPKAGKLAMEFAHEIGTLTSVPLPAILSALWHKDRYVHTAAANFLIQYAPDQFSAVAPLNQAPQLP